MTKKQPQVQSYHQFCHIALLSSYISGCVEKEYIAIVAL